MSTVATKKALSLLMALAFILGAFAFAPLAANAAEDTVIAAPPTYVALGDSVPAGYGLKGYEPKDLSLTQNYTKLFSDALNAGEFANTPLNLSVSGITTTQLLDNLGKLKTSNKAAFESLTGASLITLNIGGNNVLAPFIDLVTEIAEDKGIDLDKVTAPEVLVLMAALQTELARDDFDEVYPEFAEGIEAFTADFPKIIAWLSENAPDALLIVSNTYNPFPASAGALSAAADEMLNVMNGIITAGEEAGLYVVADVYTAFKDATVAVTNFDPVGKNFDIHPNAAGHELIAKVHVDVFEALFVDDPVFTDIEGHWALDYILFVVDCGLFSGTSDETFSPDINITRGMFITALGRLAGVDVDEYETSSYSDIPEGNYVLPYAEWALENDIAKGVGGGNFSPESAITRQDMAVMMQNFADAIGCTLPEIKEKVTFSDDSLISDYAAEAVSAIQQAGIVIGRENNMFAPLANTTRAEAATILTRFIETVFDAEDL